MELHPVRLEIGPLVAEVAAAVEHAATRNNVDIHVACLPAVLHGDRLRIRQCVFNLVGNACKFTHNGRVTVTGDLESSADGDFYALRVTDTGIGISPENLGRLFVDFTQLDASTNRKYGGSGLGLAISRRLSRLMGGDITVTSNPGEGSTFTFRVPVNAASDNQLKNNLSKDNNGNHPGS
jgi:signal transduction histidine kinase